MDKMIKILSNETNFKQIDHDETLKKLNNFNNFNIKITKINT